MSTDTFMMRESIGMLDYWDDVVGRPPEDTMLDAYLSGLVIKHKNERTTVESAANFGLTLHARAAWARDGFPTFRLSHSLTAALLMTDSDTVPLAQVLFPFNAFAIQFPGPDYPLTTPQDGDEPPRAVTGLIVQVVQTARKLADYQHVLDVLRDDAKRWIDTVNAGRRPPGNIDTVSSAARAVFAGVEQVRGIYVGLTLAPRSSPGSEGYRHPFDVPVLSTDLAGRDPATSTVGELLDSFRGKVEFRGDAEKDNRGTNMLGTLHAAGRILLNFALYVTDRDESVKHQPRGKPVRAAPVHRDRGPAVTPRVWVVGNEVKLDKQVREAARHIVTEGHGRMPWRVSARFMVRGHFREQPIGPGRTQRKRIWIQPFWKNPDTSVVLTKQYLAGSHEGEPHGR